MGDYADLFARTLILLLPKPTDGVCVVATIAVRIKKLSQISRLAVNQRFLGMASQSPYSIDMPRTMGQQFNEFPVMTSLSLILLGVMIITLIVVGFVWMRRGFCYYRCRNWPSWVTLLLAVIGLGISAYLMVAAYAGAHWVCGGLGDCRTVQDHSYLFGVIPHAMIGTVGFAVIIILWVWQVLASDKVAHITHWIPPLMILLGLLFAGYLVWLEPFVMGAICVWSLGIGLIMTLLLWLTCPKRSSSGL